MNIYALRLFARKEEDGTYLYSTSISKNPYNLYCEGTIKEIYFENEVAFKEQLNALPGKRLELSNILLHLLDKGTFCLHIQMLDEQAARFGWVL